MRKVCLVGIAVSAIGFLAAAPASNPTMARTQKRTAFFRADASPAKMPNVTLTKREEALCKVKVGDAIPPIELPQIGGGEPAKLADLLGKEATVVLFWKGNRRMAREQLADLGADVIEPFGKRGVAVIGVVVNDSESSAAEAVTKAGAKFTNLLDTDGKAFAQVGSERLPRTYVLDPDGKIVWFDIEYSLTTRRELHDALRVLVESK
jgi:peroxiredoxin